MVCTYLVYNTVVRLCQFFGCGGKANLVQISLLNPNFLLVHRNRYLKGMDNGQKTPRGHPDFNSYVKVLRVFIDNRRTNRQTDRQTDRRTEKLIRCRLGNLIGSSR